MNIKKVIRISQIGVRAKLLGIRFRKNFCFIFISVCRSVKSREVRGEGGMGVQLLLSFFLIFQRQLSSREREAKEITPTFLFFIGDGMFGFIVKLW